MIDPREFRRALGSFATGITVVTTLSPGSGMIGINSHMIGGADVAAELKKATEAFAPVLAKSEQG